jgi:hypothetical protein
MRDSIVGHAAIKNCLPEHHIRYHFDLRMNRVRWHPFLSKFFDIYAAPPAMSIFFDKIPPFLSKFFDICAVPHAMSIFFDKIPTL